MIRKLLKIKELAEIIGLKESTIRNKLYRGDSLPKSVLLGKKMRRFPIDEVDAWIAESMKSSEDVLNDK